MTVEGVNTSGYVALVNNNVSFFTIDDLAVTNTSPIYYVPVNDYPDKVYFDKDEEYDPNSYGQTGRLDAELEYLKDYNPGGCGSSVSASVVVPSIILAIVAFVVIAMRRSKHEENNN